MEISLEKGPEEYRTIEAYVGTSFFSDVGRSAIAQEINGEEARTLAEQNAVRHWMYKVATRELARERPDTPPLIDRVRSRLGLVNSLEEYIASYEVGLSS